MKNASESSRRVLYLDASALVKRVVDEAETQALEAYLSNARMATSELSVTEVTRAVRRMLGSEEAATETALRQWDDHISEHHAAGVRKVDYDRISHAVLTQGHVFIRAEAVPIIVPRRAFETMEDMQAFAADIDKRSRRSAS